VSATARQARSSSASSPAASGSEAAREGQRRQNSVSIRMQRRRGRVPRRLPPAAQTYSTALLTALRVVSFNNENSTRTWHRLVNIRCRFLPEPGEIKLFPTGLEHRNVTPKITRKQCTWSRPIVLQHSIGMPPPARTGSIAYSLTWKNSDTVIVIRTEHGNYREQITHGTG
jgi:hypothetical protein